MNRIAHAAAFVTPTRVIKFTIGATVVWIGVLILSPYPHYLPPDFGHGFLRNKESNFYGSGYFLGFYAHIATAPLALLAGTLQMSGSLRRRLPRLHRSLGTAYVVLVLGFVAPGGAIMSTRAYGGLPSTFCFALISTAAWWFTWRAWRAARAGRFPEHGRWMCRSYLMICSAIMLRLIHFAMQPLGLEAMLTYRLAAWLSWLPALAILEFILLRGHGQAGDRVQADR
jgi:uncharacterized membrane protein